MHRPLRRRTPPRLRFATALPLLLAPAVAAQEKPDPADAGQAKPDPQKPGAGQDELQALKKRMDELEKKHEQEVEELRDEIDALSAKPAQSAGQSPLQSLNVFNPQLTVFGNFFGRWDDQRVVNAAGDPVDDRFWLREAELDFRAAIDPWADGVLILSVGADSPGNFTTEIEEGYFTLKKLPVLDSDPGGLKLQIGRFRPDFGRINQIHDHDLPWMDRPPSFAAYFGDEGFKSDGLSGQFFLPSPTESSTLQATLQVVNGGDLPIAADNNAEDPAYLEHVGWFWDVASGHDVEVGESSYFSRFDQAGHEKSQVLGLDATYHWKPYASGEWNSFLLGGELFAASVEQPAGATTSRPFGWYVWSQYQLSQNLYVGARYDVHQSFPDDSLTSRQIGAYLTYYTTEFLRFRLGAEHTRSDDPAVNGLNSLLFEINIVFGSHPTEPYWVNK
jgi:hypothetical protein